MAITAQELLNEVYIKYRGKIQSRTPAFSSDKGIVALSIANTRIRQWGRDPRNKWNSLFETTAPNETGTVATAGTTTLTGTSTYFTDYRVGDTILVDGETVRTIATIVSDTSLTVTVAFSTTASSLTFTHNTIIDSTVNTYNLHRRYFLNSDYAKIVKTDGSIVEYAIPKAQQRNTINGQVAYIHGSNPKKITFAQTIDAGLDGGTLTVPGYYEPESLVLSTDIVPVDDPNWLVFITAADLASNDPANEDKAPSLRGEANEFYMGMSNANNDVGTGQPNTVLNQVPQISDDTDDWTI